MYFSRDKENKTREMQQNPEKWGCNYFRCILATEVYF